MFNRQFSHIYVEKAALGDSLAQSVIERFKDREIIEIDSYKSVFNRPRQSFGAQKNSQKIILAKRLGEFSWNGSDMCPAHGFSRFFHSTLAMNCVFDCAYCYLQGLYPSANLVLFTNIEDYFKNTADLLSGEPLFLSISYETDLLALENIIPYIRLWHTFSADKKNLLIEVRTKSANIGALEDLRAHENMVLAWSLSPQAAAKQLEIGAPAPEKRISAAKKALAMGWKVRLCFDPIIALPNWQSVYSGFFRDLAREIDFRALFDVSFGPFRVKKDHYRGIEERHAGSGLLSRIQEDDGELSYPKELRDEITAEIIGSLSALLPEERIYFHE